MSDRGGLSSERMPRIKPAAKKAKAATGDKPVRMAHKPTKGFAARLLAISAACIASATSEAKRALYGPIVEDAIKEFESEVPEKWREAGRQIVRTVFGYYADNIQTSLSTPKHYSSMQTSMFSPVAESVKMTTFSSLGGRSNPEANENDLDGFFDLLKAKQIVDDNYVPGMGRVIGPFGWRGEGQGRRSPREVQELLSKY